MVIGCVTVLRGIFAASFELRVDEAYYWTWSKESVLSYLDHPPMIAWCIRLGTFLFGDTNFGVRSTGLLAMALMQLLLADIAWRTLRDVRYVAIAVLLPEAALDYGLLIVKAAPDTPLIVFSLAMVWSLVRLALSHNPRWWLLAGLFGGLALLSKYAVVLLLPAIVAYVVVPRWRFKQLSSPYLWFAILIAVAVFSPVLYWNAVNDWASFKFQMDRPVKLQGWSARFLLDFVGQQFVLVGPLLLPAALIGTVMLAWRGYRTRDPLSILLSMSVILPISLLVWRAFYARIGDSWPLLMWPFAFANVVINLKQWRREAPASPMARAAPALLIAAIVSGSALVVTTLVYYIAGSANYLTKDDPIGKEAGFAHVAEVANKTLEAAGATWFATPDYRIYAMLRWHLRDRVPVIQINERSRYIGFRSGEVTGAIGLYVTSEDGGNGALLKNTGAVLTPVTRVDLCWRGYCYDTYSLQTLTGWKPVLSPPPGDPFYVSSPH